MKIGLVSSYMPPHLGGLEQIAENLFAGYGRHGVQVRWVASRIPIHTPTRDGNRIRVPCFNVVEDLLGVPVPLWGPQGWRALTELVDWADALHVLECLYFTSGMATLLARRRAKPVVLSQNIGFVRYRLPVLNWAEDIAYRTLGRAVLRASSHIVLATPSAALCADALLGHERPPRSMFPVGIDTERFRPPADGRRHRARAELGVPDSCPVVLFAGRFVEKKGLPIVLDVSRQLPGVHFLLAGDGPLRDMLPTGSSNITWHRMVEPESMPLFYHAADCVLLPSHGEGLPLTVQEATASGLPCVISQDEPYAGALVEAEVCAAAPRETSAMAAAVTQVLESDARPLGGRARAYAKEHWSVDTMVTRHIALFEQLLAAAVPPSA